MLSRPDKNGLRRMLLMMSIRNFMLLELGMLALRSLGHSALGPRRPFPERGFPANPGQPRVGIELLVFPPQASHDDRTRLMAEEHGSFALRFWATQPLAQEAHSPNRFPCPTQNGLYRITYIPSLFFSAWS